MTTRMIHGLLGSMLLAVLLPACGTPSIRGEYRVPEPPIRVSLSDLIDYGDHYFVQHVTVVSLNGTRFHSFLVGVFQDRGATGWDARDELFSEVGASWLAPTDSASIRGMRIPKDLDDVWLKVTIETDEGTTEKSFPLA